MKAKNDEPIADEKQNFAEIPDDLAQAAADESADSQGESPTESSVEDTHSAELEKQRKLTDEAQERFLRVQADFDNFRRRSRAEKEDFAKYASFKLIEQLLPVVDNFDRALNTGKEGKDFDSLLKGIEMTSRQLEQVLTQEGLKPIEAVGRHFNPEFHQAILQEQSAEHEEGMIIAEIQKGYMLKDKVLRPAMVKVSM